MTAVMLTKREWNIIVKLLFDVKHGINAAAADAVITRNMSFIRIAAQRPILYTYTYMYIFSTETD